jgi:hypothetical protein
MYNDDQYEEIEDPIEDDTSVEETIPKEDKIFNNRYNTGDGLVESEDYEYLKDLYEYEDALDTKLILNSIFEFVQKDPEIIILINKKTNKPFSNKLKLSKDEVNFLFNRINDSLDKKGSENLFYNPIYAMEVISSITSIEYKKLFDMMETEIQEILLIELNNKYKILDGKIHKKRIH